MLKDFIKGQVKKNKFLTSLYRKSRNKFMLRKTKNTALAMCLLCKDEADILDRWFMFHKAMGVDFFIVTDNCSSDQTENILKKYKDMGWIKEIIFEPSQTYEQTKWVDKMINIAKVKYKADWIISADADEFWFAESLNLKTDILKNKNVNLQYVKSLNYVPFPDGADKDEYESPYFKTRELYDFEAKKIDNSLLECTGMPLPKVVILAKDYMHIAMGNHNASVKRKKCAYISNIRIYHYVVRSKKHFKKKILKAKSIINVSDTSLGKHWRIWYDDYIKNKDIDKLWENHFRYKYFDVLCELGVIVKDKTMINFSKTIDI